MSDRAEPLTQADLAAVRDLVDSFDFLDVDLDYTVEDVSGAGDVAYVVATFQGGWTEGGEAVSTSGKGINLFRRQADGSWRMSHYCWTPDP